MKEQFLLRKNSSEYYGLMNQSGVKHHILPSPSVFNASWDAFLSKENEIYFSLCTELTTSEYAKLARFNRKTEEVEELFYTKTTYFNNDRLIRDSKIHTAISEMEDNRLIMLTHTTDKAPEHPAWLPNAYYSNPWSGYAGSQLLIYDPKNNSVEYLGIPVQRETLYGAVYSPISKAYYALGYIKGHLYKINVETMEVKDYGQVVERASYRLIIGSDDNIYFSSRNGILMRLDIKEDKVINLNLQLPNDQKNKNTKKGYISYALNGPDGKLYISTQFTDKLSVYDPKENTLEILGSYKSADEYTDVVAGFDHMAAMGFDKNGVLYGTACHIRYDSEEDFKVPTALIRWDIFNNEEPEFLGIVGSAEKAVVTNCSMIMDHASDEMFIFGTNHGNDAPDILQVDLNKFRENAKDITVKCADVYIDPNNQDYLEHNESIVDTVNYWNNNPYYYTKNLKATVAIWETAVLNPGEHKIVGLNVHNNIVVELSNGESITYDFEGQELERNKINNNDSSNPLILEKNNLPFSYPGRQFASLESYVIKLLSGNKVHVTKEGILVVESKEKTYRNYGPVWINAPLISWKRLNNSDVIYGVAGDKDDISTLFMFTEAKGINWLGYLGVDTVEMGAFNSPLGGYVGISEDDNFLVVASGTTLPSLYIYEIGGN